MRGTRNMPDPQRKGSLGSQRGEIQNFDDFLEPRLKGQRLDWEYSNPNFTMNWEFYINKVGVGVGVGVGGCVEAPWAPLSPSPLSPPPLPRARACPRSGNTATSDTSAALG